MIGKVNGYYFIFAIKILIIIVGFVLLNIGFYKDYNLFCLMIAIIIIIIAIIIIIIITINIVIINWSGPILTLFCMGDWYGQRPKDGVR